MSIFQIPKKNTQELLNKQKYNKIYVFSRKKCNPFSTPSSTLDPLKFNLFTHNPCQMRRKKSDRVDYRQERLFQSENPKQSHSFSLEYQQQQRLDSLMQKRKSIKQKLVEHFRNSTLKSKYDRQKTCKLESFRQPKAITSKSLMSNFKRFDRSLNKTQQLQKGTQYKKSSLPDLNRHTKLQITSLTSSLKRKNVKGKYKITLPIFIEKQSQFIKNGMINGLKISNPSPQNIRRIKTEKNKFKIQNSQLPCQKNIDSLDRQYPYVKKAQTKIIDDKLHQKVSRKNILQLRRRRSLQNDVFKITKFNGKSLIKIQKLVSKIEIKSISQR